MTTRRAAPLLASLLALGLALAAHVASGQPPSGAAPAASDPAPASASASGSASTSASGSASASASGSAAPAAAPTSFTNLVVPEEHSPRPKPAEWKAATPFFSRLFSPRCRALLVREWVRVECQPSPLSAITLFSGPSKEYTATSGSFNEPDMSHGFHLPDMEQNPALILFPLRRGARYQIGISSAGLANYQSDEISYHTPLMISAYWLEEDSSPTLVFGSP